MKGIWATSALNNDHVVNALVLCHSLRRAHSRIPVAVLTSRVHVNMNLRAALGSHFDFVIDIEDDTENEKNAAGGCAAENGANNFASVVTSLSKKFKMFQQVLYLSPNILVIRNCDDMFTWPSTCVDMYAENYFFSKDKSVGFFTPTWITHYYHQTDFTAFQNKFANKLEQLVNSRLMRITEIPEFGASHFSKCDKIYLINFDNSFNLLNVQKLPDEDDVWSVYRNAVQFWQSIYNDHVKPTLDGISNGCLPHSKFPIEKLNQAYAPNEPIAVIGMSCKFAGANSLTEFWNILINGKITVAKPPTHRYSNGQFPPNFQMDAGYLKDPIDVFDNAFFGIAAKEAIHMDPQHRLLFHLVWEALENAGISLENLKNTPGGIFMGSWNYQYKNILNKASCASGENNFYRNYMGSSSSACLGRLAMLLGFTGPTMAYETSCSASAVAVHSACKSLQNGEATLALACGVNLIVTPFERQDLPGMLAEDGHCKTFDVQANGYGRGEGCGVLVLKRLGDAVRDGDRIWGIIRGSGVCQEGMTKSLATPTVQAEGMAMKRALKDAGVMAKQVGFLEMHGTGTVVGDAVEVKAAAEVYGGSARENGENLYLGSVKSNIGHTESCSGIASIIKVLLAIHYGKIPRQVELVELNPKLSKIMQAIPATVPMETVSWSKREDGSKRYAGVSSFGMTGTNVHFILEERPEKQQGFQKIFNNLLADRPLHIMKISAKSEQALTLLLEKYRSFLMEEDGGQGQLQFSDMAYTANVGRSDWSHRAVVIANSKEQAAEYIEEGKLFRGKVSHDSETSREKICFLFTGQGSQFPGMGKVFYETNYVFRINFDYCLSIIKRIDESLSGKMKQIMWASENSCDDTLSCCHLSIFCLEYSLLKVWESFGVKPDIVLGHSLGEFAAAAAAGALQVEQAIWLIFERSRLIKESISEGQGGMLVLRENEKRVKKMLKEFLENNKNGNRKNVVLQVAAVNAMDQTVVSGDNEAIQIFEKFCLASGVKTKCLDNTLYAFHSAHMTPILKEYESRAERILKDNGGGLSKNAKCVYISGMTGKSLVDDLSVLTTGKYWKSHTRKPVQFYKANQLALEMGTSIFLEIGPQPLLSALALNNAENSELLVVPSIRKNENEWMTLFESMAKLYVNGRVKINWHAVDAWNARKILDLPHYPFSGKRFWPKVTTSRSYSIAECGGAPLINDNADQSSETFNRDSAGAAIMQQGKSENNGLGHDGYITSPCHLNGKISLKKCITSVVKNVLKMDDGDELKDDTNFEEMGVDSLMYLEICNAVSQQLRVLFGKQQQRKVTLSTVKKSLNIRMLTEQVELLIGKQ